jgi:hypothetical protein
MRFVRPRSTSRACPGDLRLELVDALYDDIVWILRRYHLRVDAARQPGHHTLGDGTAIDSFRRRHAGDLGPLHRPARQRPGWTRTCAASGSRPPARFAPAIQFIGHDGYPDAARCAPAAAVPSADPRLLVSPLPRRQRPRAAVRVGHALPGSRQCLTGTSGAAPRPVRAARERMPSAGANTSLRAHFTMTIVTGSPAPARRRSSTRRASSGRRRARAVQRSDRPGAHDLRTAHTSVRGPARL